MIGYAATDDELFLIYEYAQKGSLRNHLHDPQSRGKIHIRVLWVLKQLVVKTNYTYGSRLSQRAEFLFSFLAVKI